MLEFRSNNSKHQPIIEALDLIKKHIIPPKFKKVVLETDKNGDFELTYELRDFSSLFPTGKLKCKHEGDTEQRSLSSPH